jgi:two-component system CheB/CheR fusion protein
MANAPRKKSPKNKEKKRATQPAPEASLNFPIVAIGASAGGLEAFSNLLRALPPQPGVALIFIPHLDPTHESAMVELLSRTTRLPVFQAAEGMRVQVNSVTCFLPIPT